MWEGSDPSVTALLICHFHSVWERESKTIYLARPFFLRRNSPLWAEGLLIVKASRSHSVTPYSVGLLWTSDQPDSGRCTWQHTALRRERDINSPAGFEPAVPASEWTFFGRSWRYSLCVIDYEFISGKHLYNKFSERLSGSLVPHIQFAVSLSPR